MDAFRDGTAVVIVTIVAALAAVGNRFVIADRVDAFANMTVRPIGLTVAIVFAGDTAVSEFAGTSRFQANTGEAAVFALRAIEVFLAAVFAFFKHAKA